MQKILAITFCGMMILNLQRGFLDALILSALSVFILAPFIWVGLKIKNRHQGNQTSDLGQKVFYRP